MQTPVSILFLVVVLFVGVAIGAAIVFVLVFSRGSMRGDSAPSDSTRRGGNARNSYGVADTSHGFIPGYTASSASDHRAREHGGLAAHESARVDNEHAATAEGTHAREHCSGHDGGHDGGHEGGHDGGADGGDGGGGGGE